MAANAASPSPGLEVDRRNRFGRYQHLKPEATGVEHGLLDAVVRRQSDHDAAFNLSLEQDVLEFGRFARRRSADRES